MKKEIKCGTYETRLIVKIYANRICITKPYINLVNNYGSLAFEKFIIKSSKFIPALRSSAIYDHIFFWKIVDDMIKEL